SVQAPYTGEWINPTVGEETSSYGMRVNPVTGVYEGHSGTDIGAPAKAEIHAAGSGKVTIAGKSSGGNSGYMVAIDHGGGVQSRYVHSFPEDIKVKVGQEVKVGEVVALVGMSGNATGYHLHFEIRINGTPTDPKAWMKEKGVTTGVGPNKTKQKVEAKDRDDEKDAPSTAAEEPDEEKDSDEKVEKVSSTQARSYKSSEGEVFTPNAKQWKNIQTVLKTVDESGMGKRAAIITMETVLVESKGRNYANVNVPASMNLPHEAVGEDHDSVGLFQQRPSMGWGEPKQLLDPVYATNKFLSTLAKVPNWENRRFGDAAQAVQISGVPDAYDKWESAATAIVNDKDSNYDYDSTGSIGSTGCSPTGPVDTSSQDGKPQQPADSATGNDDQSGLESTPDNTRRRIINAAKANLDTPYKAGGRTTQGWDSNGMIYWTTNHVGLKGIPYVDAYSTATKTETPSGGDLLYCGKRPDGTYTSAGIHSGNDDTYYTVIDSKGTIEAPIPSSCEAYTLFRSQS
ncbi:MAG: peptidoglycan DD-metalloendopeptidase family protein, partial [Galactobacter sp.]